ncbi:hypothetical protein [Flammeovirga aprica]|uniref:Uncharacterized protein n=1 Tax=Flammeovirga aprica JL-4 TaxID=694437 RepID=A0A7X9RU46_9BACT|nr:hypothetical protein [Flammeovirga aprica]NME68522.1 hypothetical protein [Flammeovirga aprica JL-4]
METKDEIIFESRPNILTLLISVLGLVSVGYFLYETFLHLKDVNLSSIHPFFLVLTVGFLVFGLSCIWLIFYTTAKVRLTKNALLLNNGIRYRKIILTDINRITKKERVEVIKGKLRFIQITEKKV